MIHLKRHIVEPKNNGNKSSTEPLLYNPKGYVHYFNIPFLNIYEDISGDKTSVLKSIDKYLTNSCIIAPINLRFSSDFSNVYKYVTRFNKIITSNGFCFLDRGTLIETFGAGFPLVKIWWTTVIDKEYAKCFPYLEYLNKDFDSSKIELWVSEEVLGNTSVLSFFKYYLNEINYSPKDTKLKIVFKKNMLHSNGISIKTEIKTVEDLDKINNLVKDLWKKSPKNSFDKNSLKSLFGINRADLESVYIPNLRFVKQDPQLKKEFKKKELEKKNNVVLLNDEKTEELPF